MCSVRSLPWVQSILGAAISPEPLTSSTDPMSGFFCVNKTTLAKGRAKCNPIGFKIGLEIMARCRCEKVEDIGITFRERVAGESKLTMKQNLYYLQQLLALYLDQWDKMIIVLGALAFVAVMVLFSIYMLYKFVILMLFLRQVHKEEVDESVPADYVKVP